MTNAARWLFLIPVVFVAALVPFVVTSRDPLEEARKQFASMTAAERKSIERSREAYDKLTSLEQFELRQFASDLEKLSKADPKEYAELEATMGRLQAWVGTFPDDVRTKYEKGMPSERLSILKEQIRLLEEEKKGLIAQLRQADSVAQKAASTQPGMKTKNPDPKRALERIEKVIRANGTADDQELLKLAKDPYKLKPPEHKVVLGCTSFASGQRPAAKVMIGRIESAADQVPIGLLKRIGIVPAFKRLPAEPGNGLPDANRADLMKVLPQIYLLTPPEKSLDMDELLNRLNVPWEMRPRPPEPPPMYLLNQLALLKDYSEGKSKPPLKDMARVKKVLEKSP